jgi:hypothetical protein
MPISSTASVAPKIWIFKFTGRYEQKEGGMAFNIFELTRSWDF